jgi:hypothetical protein
MKAAPKRRKMILLRRRLVWYVNTGRSDIYWQGFYEPILLAEPIAARTPFAARSSFIFAR